MFCSGIRHRGEQTAFAISINSNTANWDLIADGIGFTPIVAVTVAITVGNNVLVRDLVSGSPTQAMDLSGLPSGSTINLTNLGYIQGQGGAGGAGSANGSNGGNGGTAIKGPGSGRTFNVTNGSGQIWGGGGGGGGGGGCTQWHVVDLTYEPTNPGAGGGGGAGGSDGGSSITDAGAAGTSGISGTFGAGGEGHTGVHGDAGNGGDWGEGGDDGVSGFRHGGGADGVSMNNAGVGGSGGYAVDLNGGTINWISGSADPRVKGTVA